MKESEVSSVLSDSLRPHGLQPLHPLSHVGSPSCAGSFDYDPISHERKLRFREEVGHTWGWRWDSDPGLPVSRALLSAVTGVPSFCHSSHCLLGPCSVVSDSLLPLDCRPTRLLRPWNFPGRNTGVGCHFLLQGIFPTQGLNPHLLDSQANSFFFFFDFQAGVFQKGCHTNGQGTMALSNGRRNSLPLCHLGEAPYPS